ncbi:Rhs-family protein [Minicystis rosea]|nr:Rhs-family protein [Minicystis rosea]
MRSNRTFLVGLGIFGLSIAATAAVSCGGTGSTAATSGTAGQGGHAGAGGSGHGGHAGSTASSTGTGSSTTCHADADCDGGACVGGACCADVADVCGQQCCTGDTVCLFDKCVVPGKDCHTANDCGPGQYCETALGTQPGAPDGGADGGLCTAPLPLGGKCLDLPPVCAGDAGTPGPDAGCVALCEYHPPAGALNAVQKWAWGDTVSVKPNFVDVWSTPTVGRVYDGNCDGKVDELDSPVVVVVTGNVYVNGVGSNCQSASGGGATSGCHTGVLRMIDGRTGQEIWSLAKPSASSIGFAGMSVALGDVDGDGRMDIVAVSGEGYVVLIDDQGNVKRTSDKPIPGNAAATFGWGGGLSIADMDGDGFPEIAYGATVFTTTNGAITLKFTGTGGVGGGNAQQALSTFVDLDGAPDNHLELLAGNTAYRADGTILWQSAIVDGFPGVGDFDLDGKPDVVVVGNGNLWILDGATGATVLGPVKVPGTGSGGPPTVADFDGDGKPEIGVAMATFYSMLKPDYVGKKIDVVWQTPNHDLSSSVTGSSVFDFEGDGKAEVIYADECFLWVFDGQTGAVRFAASHTSFTATEASLVADVDGDGRAEILMISNAADPSSAGWGCMNASNQPVVVNGVTWTPGTATGKGYRGVVAFGDVANSWVGTRTLWNQHTYHVSNICDDRDSACDAPNVYGSIPKVEKKNWSLPWLNNFRQNVQDKGLFDAPDATLSLSIDCGSPAKAHVQVRNIGLASLPAGVVVAVFKRQGGMDTQIGTASTTHALFPGQTEEVVVSIDPALAGLKDTFVAKVVIDPVMPKFHECREDNNESEPATSHCVQ